ncbi:cell division protein ZapA [Kingella negevensis]|uniref:Cell division protein ZapA n=1 Tax=Kingella negevensis TaxID=1522312 RepID=A0A238HGR2_9NEIS|nr:cell division protein ZapA [Kingella negevensis]MDK4681205.1 cell division protein ZapA [Kingella negevensis]MDK4683402.1 cell division protein ZapA [Kingella negevensis]MDK4685054.1 cell division protein ZapA [Kingella negevensis]MDK4689527.1 cell division protein ZapA [Kingella negevensis]MDK4691463.1 cell division protein ZapA [Kingella negevensis]
MSIEQISVEILNRTFTIGTPESERGTLHKAVEMLNQKITAIQNAGKNMETEKVVIMAALNLTHDLLKAADKAAEINSKKALPNEEDERKISALIELCETALKTAPEADIETEIEVE